MIYQRYTKSFFSFFFCFVFFCFSRFPMLCKVKKNNRAEQVLDARTCLFNMCTKMSCNLL